MSGAIYGNAPLKSAKSAFFRGTGAGAATAAINNLSNAWDTRNAGYESSAGVGLSGGTAAGWANPYGTKREPKTICGAASPFGNNIGYSTAYGYQYGQSHGGVGTSSAQNKRGGFSLGEFAKYVLISAVTGGMASATFYGAGKAVEALKGSIRGNKSGRNAKEINRAVSPEEFDDIFATRSFRQKPNGRSFQVKEFGNSLAETIDFANQPINVDKAAIVGVKIPKNIYNQLNHMNLDRRFFKSGTPKVEPEMLDAFNKSIIDIKHVF